MLRVLIKGNIMLWSRPLYNLMILARQNPGMNKKKVRESLYRIFKRELYITGRVLIGKSSLAFEEQWDGGRLWRLTGKAIYVGRRRCHSRRMQSQYTKRDEVDMTSKSLLY